MHIGRKNIERTYKLASVEGIIDLAVKKCVVNKCDTGVNIQPNLQNDKHITNICAKANGIVGINKHTFSHININMLRILYKSLVRPILQYCSSNMEPYTKVSARKIEQIQHLITQFSSYLNSHNLYNTCQSAYRPGHSTETVLLKVVNDLFLSLNKGNISALALLDFSSAFDTIDPSILVHRLHTDFGFTDTVLQWFSSYQTDRTNYVSLSKHCSAFAPVYSGVPQGSVLGPILFTMYIKPMSAII